MIFSKAALQIFSISKKDSNLPMLNNVKLEEDGTAVSAARNIVMVSQPVPEEVLKRVPIENEGSVNTPITSETIGVILPSVKDTAFGGALEFINVKEAGEKVEFTYMDGKRQTSVKVNPVPEKWLPWKKIFRRAFKERTGQKIILNLSRLKLLVDLFEKALQDKGGEGAIYLEFSKESLIMKMFNHNTGQWIYAIMTLSFGEWPEGIEFEEKILAKRAVKK